MMLILLIVLLIDHIQPFEWNCTKSSSITLVHNQCLIIVEYLSIDDHRQQCSTDRLTIRTLPPPSYSLNYSMKLFRMNFCQLRTLSQLPFTLPSSLETLDLSYNLLTSFTLAFPLPSTIKYLNLSHNPDLLEIHFGPKYVQDNLISLTLGHNHRMQVSSLPQSLIELDLTACHLAQSTTIFTLFKSLKNLTHLSLAENQFDQLPRLEQRMRLKSLNLSKNYLTEFDEHWWNEDLHILDLSSNQIHSLQFFHNRSQSNILQLSLHDNPLSCDCYFSSLLRSSSINLINSSSLPCSSSDLFCTYSQHCTLGCTCCDFEACDCHSICPWDCSCEHDAAWINHRINCRERNLTVMHVLLPESLTELNYEGNHLQTINPSLFLGKIHLQKLNLARNQLKDFTNETFCAAKNLQEIHFSTNPQLMNILPNLNQLFACLKSLQYVYLSREQLHGEISDSWVIDHEENDDVIRLKRMTIDSIIHQEFYTTTSLMEHHQAFLFLLFFVLLFLLLFSLLLISLAICRRKLHQLQVQRTRVNYPTLTSVSMKIPENPPVNESVYEQLPSLSSDSEQPFLHQQDKSLISSPPALPPYPPLLVLGTRSPMFLDTHLFVQRERK